jgi:hypothetical protein
LEASIAEMRLAVDGSSEVVTVMHHELDARIKDYEFMRAGNGLPLHECNKAQGLVANLEERLADTKADVAKDITC